MSSKTTDHWTDVAIQTDLQGYEKFDLEKWLQKPRKMSEIEQFLHKIYNLKNNISIQNDGLLSFSRSDLTLATGRCVVLIPKYEMTIGFRKIHLEKDNMRFFKVLFSNTYKEKTFGCKIDTSVFTAPKKTFVEGATFVVLKNTDIYSILSEDAFEWEYEHHKKKFYNLF